MIVAIDIGNSAIKCLSDQPDAKLLRLPLDQPHWASQFRAAYGWSADTRVRIASVNQKGLTECLVALSLTETSSANVHLLDHQDIPLDIRTDSPDRVGIDRLVGAVGASQQTSDAAVVVDAGTTVTVDQVEGKAFQGGAIIPGLRMQLNALGRGTDALPAIESLDLTTAANLGPGKNTADAIRLGVESSIIGGVTRLIHAYGSPRDVFVTGGDGNWVTEQLTRQAGLPEQNTRIHWQPNLVCQTLLSDEFGK